MTKLVKMTVEPREISTSLESDNIMGENDNEFGVTLYKDAAITLMKKKDAGGTTPGGTFIESGAALIQTDGTNAHPTQGVDNSASAKQYDQFANNDCEGARRWYHYMNNLWNSAKLCDVILETKGGDIFAHKVALAAHSDVIAGQFTRLPKGKRFGINLKDYSKDTILVIVKFAYTNKLALTDDNVVHILSVCNELGLKALSAMCLEYINQTICEQNAELFYEAADFRGMEDMRRDILMTYNVTFKDEQKLLTMSFQTLLATLHAHKLCVESELDVFLVIVRWVDHDRNNRLKLAPLLLKFVRYQLIPLRDIIEKIESVRWFFLKRECYEWLYNVMRYFALHEHGCDDTYDYIEHQRRLSGGTSATLSMSDGPLRGPRIVAVGGYNKSNTTAFSPGCCVYEFNTQVNAWTFLTTKAKHVYHHTVTDVNGKLYVIGGMSNTTGTRAQATKNVETYDPETDKWSSISPMSKNRANHSVVTWCGNIYVIGGHDENNSVVKSIECYDTERNEWTIVSMMEHTKRGAATAVLEGCIYIVGGVSEAGDNTSDVACFDLERLTWTWKKRLPAPRAYANLVNVNDRLWLVCGLTTNPGQQKVFSTASLDRYNSYDDVWEHVTDMDHPRHDAGCVALGTYIHIFGGIQTRDGALLDSVECFNAENQLRVGCVASLPSPTAGLSCCHLSHR